MYDTDAMISCQEHCVFLISSSLHLITSVPNKSTTDSFFILKCRFCCSAHLVCLVPFSSTLSNCRLNLFSVNTPFLSVASLPSGRRPGSDHLCQMLPNRAGPRRRTRNQLTSERRQEEARRAPPGLNHRLIHQDRQTFVVPKTERTICNNLISLIWNCIDLTFNVTDQGLSFNNILSVH